MKKLLRSYTAFTRTERIGLVCLCSLLVLLIAIRFTMPLWVHPVTGTAEERRLQAAWEVYKRSQRQQDSMPVARKDFEDAGSEASTALADTIFINSADSATLIRLKGIGPVTAHKILERRARRGLFTDIRQLSETGSFSKANLDLLRKHISFAVPAGR